MTRSVALIYVRVSRLDEDERARKVSPDVQREKALALRDLAGLNVEQFEDLDISGKSATNRPAYQRLLARLGPDVRYVVAYDLSRLTRDVGDLEDLLRAARLHGADIIDAMNGSTIHPDRPRDKMVARMQGVINQNYLEELAEKVSDALALKVGRGETVGPPPLGYRRGREILPNGKIARVWTEPDPDVAPVVQLIFREYATGLYSLKSLARKLNAERVAKPQRTDIRPGRGARHDGTARRAAVWTADTLKDLLNNRRYLGKVPRNDGTEHDAAFPALVDAATWAACERRRVAGRRIRLSGTKRASPYLLSGVLRCPRCHSTMSGERRPPDRWHGERRYYTCYTRRTAKACDQPYLSQARLEEDLYALLSAIALPEGLAEAVDAAVAQMGVGQKRQGRKSTLRALEDRVARLKDLYELGDIQRDEYLRKRDALRHEIGALQSAPEPSFVRQRTMLRSLVDDWQHLTVDERKRIVGMIFEAILPNDEGLEEWVPRESWKTYVRAVLPAKGGSERKTGLEHTNPPFYVTSGDHIRRAA